MPGILVIRGGAIGDFILTLPAIRLLREAFPDAPLEILGYKQIVSLAEGRYYARATRSIEYAGLASFFIPGGALPGDLADYFAGFGQVISYLYDPDGFFEGNLRRAGVKNLLNAYSRIDESAHASRQLARPLERLALYLGPEREHERAILHPSGDDRAFATEFFRGKEGGGKTSHGHAHTGRSASPLPLTVAVHPGSGGKQKCWPLEQWRRLLREVRQLPDAPEILLVGGEADTVQIAALNDLAHRTAVNLPLPRLAAVLEQCAVFVGHDSGISHLAAAVGTPCVLLFGPTNPAVWAPAGEHVLPVLAPEGTLTQLDPEPVLARLSKFLIME